MLFCKTAFFVTIAVSLLPQNPDLGPLCTVRKIPFCAKLGENPKLTFPYLIWHKMNFFGYEKILWSNLNQFFTLRPLCAIFKKKFFELREKRYSNYCFNLLPRMWKCSEKCEIGRKSFGSRTFCPTWLWTMHLAPAHCAPDINFLGLSYQAPIYR